MWYENKSKECLIKNKFDVLHQHYNIAFTDVIMIQLHSFIILSIFPIIYFYYLSLVKDPFSFYVSIMLYSNIKMHGYTQPQTWQKCISTNGKNEKQLTYSYFGIKRHFIKKNGEYYEFSLLFELILIIIYNSMCI